MPRLHPPQAEGAESFQLVEVLMGSRHGECSAVGAPGWRAPGAQAAFSPAVQRTVLEDGELLLHRLRDIRQVSGPLTVLATVPPRPALGPVRFLSPLFLDGGVSSTDLELSEGWREDASSGRRSSAWGLPRAPPGCARRGLALRPRCAQRRPTPAGIPVADGPDTLLRGRAQGRGPTRLPVRWWPASRPVPPGVWQPAGRGCGHQRCDHLGWPGAPGSWPRGAGWGSSERALGAAGQGWVLLPSPPLLPRLSYWFPTRQVSSAPGPRLGQSPRGCCPASPALLGTPRIAAPAGYSEVAPEQSGWGPALGVDSPGDRGLGR